MNILWTGFLSKNHSWSIVAQSLTRSLIKLGHNVDLLSCNGSDKFPNDLLNNLKYSFDGGNLKEHFKNSSNLLLKEYDIQLSYTYPLNFQYFFNKGNKNRFAIWNYETTVLPAGISKYHKYIDKLLPSSKFSKDIFTLNKIPESKQVIVPHGVDLLKFAPKPFSSFKLKTNKKYKVFVNIAQPHYRKNIDGILKAWNKAFTKKDDVCLILKVSSNFNKNKQLFEIDFNSMLKSNINNNTAEIEIIDYYIPNIEDLYLACDIVWTMSHAECFWLPGIEGMAANKLVIAPRYGGQLDFMNDNNSILIDGNKVKVKPEYQYWNTKFEYNSKMFNPSIDDSALKLKDAVKYYDDYLLRFKDNMRETVEKFSWDNAAKQILSLVQ